MNIVVVTKAPIPGLVKTRLCPPCTAQQAAAIAEAALADTLATVDATPATHRTLLLSGAYPPPAGWRSFAQRGASLAERLAHGCSDTAVRATPSLLIGMDTPQVTPDLLVQVGAGLRDADVVIAPAVDGGWWALALRNAEAGRVLCDVAMSTADTAALTAAEFQRRGLRVAAGPTLRDVDTFSDAVAVTESCPDSRFGAAVRSVLAHGHHKSEPVPA